MFCNFDVEKNCSLLHEFQCPPSQTICIILNLSFIHRPVKTQTDLFVPSWPIIMVYFLKIIPIYNLQFWDSDSN